jgi:DNA-binding transcriptional regulator PaaX
LYILNNDTYKLSKKGLIYYQNPYKSIREKLEKKNKIIIIFDIPENKKRVRDWIRRQIKFWDFEMIQKSVWMGYGPLPKEFSRRLKILKCENGVKIFNVYPKNISTS